MYIVFYIVFCDYGFSGQSGYSDHSFVDGPPSVLIATIMDDWI